MSATASPAGQDWPSVDPEGRAVQFTNRDPRPRLDEFEPILRGTAVRLEPMKESHLQALCAVGLDQRISRFLPHPLKTPEQMAEYVRSAVAARAARTAIPFVTIFLEPTGAATVVGSTRFMSIDSANRRMEIGSTWIGLAWQRTRVNTEAKYLMLRHAFQTLRCLRVEFKTDSLNTRSRDALLRIGAIQEGIFRNHVITSDGRVRHSVYFSIVSEDWPAVRSRLEGFLAP